MTRNQPRIDLYTTKEAPVDVMEARYRWRLWKGSRIVGASTQAYTEMRGAVENMETVTGGRFIVTSDPDHPTPYGELLLTRWDPELDERGTPVAPAYPMRIWAELVPVRLVS